MWRISYMFKRVFDELGRGVSGGVAFNHVSEVSRHHRIQVSPGIRDAVNYAAEALRGYGVRCRDQAPQAGWEGTGLEQPHVQGVEPRREEHTVTIYLIGDTDALGPTSGPASDNLYTRPRVFEPSPAPHTSPPNHRRRRRRSRRTRRPVRTPRIGSPVEIGKLQGTSGGALVSIHHPR